MLTQASTHNSKFHVQETGSYLQNLWKSYHDWQSLVVFPMSEKAKTTALHELMLSTSVSSITHSFGHTKITWYDGTCASPCASCPRCHWPVGDVLGSFISSCMRHSLRTLVGGHVCARSARSPDGQTQVWETFERHNKHKLNTSHSSQLWWNVTKTIK